MEKNDAFCLHIQFDKNVTTPHVLFQTIASIIINIQDIDKSLIDYIDSEIQPIIVLDDIEKGSIKIWLRDLLKTVDDNAIKDLDWKKVIGNYLLMAKYKLLDYLGDKETLTKENVIELDDSMYEIAKKTGLRYFNDYGIVDKKKLLCSLGELSTTMNNLPEDTNIDYFIDEYNPVRINKKFKLPYESIQEILEVESITNTCKIIFKIKKPDYLGESQWVFKHGLKTVYAKIEDKEWLKSFQNRKIDVRPGDSLEVTVTITNSYDISNELINEKYIVTKVHKVIPYSKHEQMTIDEIV